MSGDIRSYRDLIAWQKGIELCKQVYGVSALFPDGERFGLTSQVRRAAVSVPSNIAEGYGRRRTNDYLRFLDMALGSLFEVETQLTLAGELGFVSTADVQACSDLVREEGRVLFGLRRSVSEGARRGAKPPRG